MERAEGGRVRAPKWTSRPPAEGKPGFLAEGIVHLWSWLLSVDVQKLSELEETLSDDEWRRVSRLRSHCDARNFIARRGKMRQILGRYLDLPPHEIRFRYGPQGKPLLVQSRESSLSFNLSDSGELAVLALCCGCPIGVDVERIRPCFEAAAIDAPCLARSGIGQADSHHNRGDANAFFRSWTEKEAVAKGKGSGLRFSSATQTSAPAVPGSRPLDIHLDEGPDAWRIYPLPLPPGYVGALAATLDVENIICFPCSPCLTPASKP